MAARPDELAIRGIEANLGPVWGDSFADDKHPDLRADFILSNPPFNISQWGGDRLTDDKRWVYSVPPKGNANYAWIQHMLHHLSPTGTMAVVLANGSLTVNTSDRGEIRQRMVEDDVVECIVALPSQLFYSVQIPVSVWLLTKDKTAKKVKSEDSQRDRQGEVLFIGARNMDYMESRTQRNLSPEDVTRIADTYNMWRGNLNLQPYEDIPGCCAAVSLDDVAEAGFALSPGRYIWADEVETTASPSRRSNSCTHKANVRPSCATCSIVHETELFPIKTGRPPRSSFHF